MNSDEKCKFDSGKQRKTGKTSQTKLNHYLSKKSIRFSKKSLEKKEINKQLITFPYFNSWHGHFCSDYN